MAEIRPIRSDADYQSALARIEQLMDAEEGTKRGTELDVLADLVEHYEAKRVPMALPSLAAAIDFRLAQSGLSVTDVDGLLDGAATLAEIRSGDRKLTIALARLLHERLGIPAEVLLGHPQHGMHGPSVLTDQPTHG